MVFDFIIIFFGIQMLLVLAFIVIVMHKDNLILLLVAVEMLILAVNLLFGFIGFYLDDLFSVMLILILLAIAAADSAVGLALMVSFYRLRFHISVALLNVNKG
jgi:NADH-quinone oxidoreductase subunit K